MYAPIGTMDGLILDMSTFDTFGLIYQVVSLNISRRCHKKTPLRPIVNLVLESITLLDPSGVGYKNICT